MNADGSNVAQTNRASVRERSPRLGSRANPHPLSKAPAPSPAITDPATRIALINELRRYLAFKSHFGDRLPE
jgi:hypothetical protein